ncbi:hypothetical protein [Actinomadura sp. DC4]|uniref:hypothetical protein n=1 Tax=Actinomadura sp. DC4 TaxID=3055069 RepID=UPI0025B05EC2|nr:hypothetical protein [Actinomadura sp. DC4]MDN3358622.1 hypothetical protein [Actinomadura sp. DC4]
MDDAALPTALQEALTTKTAGATGVARLAIAGLLELTGDRGALEQAAAILSARLPGYAPIWHIGNAVHGDEPAAALRRIRRELDEDVDKSVAAAAQWVAGHGGAVTVAPSSSVVSQVLARLGHGTDDDAAIGLAGADAIGATEVLNIKGTAELAARVPMLVVTTSLKLVPESVFSRLGAPVFERIPLSAFAAVALDGEILDPEDVGRRAAAIGG